MMQQWHHPQSGLTRQRLPAVGTLSETGKKVRPLTEGNAAACGWTLLEVVDPIPPTDAELAAAEEATLRSEVGAALAGPGGQGIVEAVCGFVEALEALDDIEGVALPEALTFAELADEIKRLRGLGVDLANEAQELQCRYDHYVVRVGGNLRTAGQWLPVIQEILTSA